MKKILSLLICLSLAFVVSAQEEAASDAKNEVKTEQVEKTATKKSGCCASKAKADCSKAKASASTDAKVEGKAACASKGKGEKAGCSAKAKESKGCCAKKTADAEKAPEKPEPTGEQEESGSDS